MTPGYCGFFDTPDWLDETDGEEYYEAILTDDGACIVDTDGAYWKCWIESDLMIPLGDAR